MKIVISYSHPPEQFFGNVNRDVCGKYKVELLVARKILFAVL